jgi:hypothetical protein
MIGPSIKRERERERERIQLLCTWKKLSSIVVISCKQVEDIQKNVPMIEIRFSWIKLQK